MVALRCQKPAEWVIWFGPDPYDCTEGCAEHVGLLLNDGQEHKVFPIGVDKTEEEVERAVCCFVE